MRLSRWMVLWAAMASGAALPACAAEEEHVVYVERDPPPERVEVVSVSPGPEYVLVRGHWHWNGVDYVWIPGHWLRRPRGSAVWVEGHWRRARGGWVWVEGHWQ